LTVGGSMSDIKIGMHRINQAAELSQKQEAVRTEKPQVQKTDTVALHALNIESKESSHIQSQISVKPNTASEMIKEAFSKTLGVLEKMVKSIGKAFSQLASQLHPKVSKEKILENPQTQAPPKEYSLAELNRLAVEGSTHAGEAAPLTPITFYQDRPFAINILKQLIPVLVNKYTTNTDEHGMFRVSARQSSIKEVEKELENMHSQGKTDLNLDKTEDLPDSMKNLKVKDMLLADVFKRVLQKGAVLPSSAEHPQLKRAADELSKGDEKEALSALKEGLTQLNAEDYDILKSLVSLFKTASLSKQTPWGSADDTTENKESAFSKSLIVGMGLERNVVLLMMKNYESLFSEK